MQGFENGIWTKLLCWSLALFVIGINIWTVVSYVSDPNSPTPYDTWFFIAVGAAGIAYLGFIAVVVKDDVLEFATWVKGGCNVEASKKANLTLNAEASETQPLIGRSA